MHSLTIQGLQKSYGAYHAVRGVDLAVEPGEFVVMVGPSGCGKSTLLRCIAGLETVSAGEIHIGGREVTRAEPSDRGVAMVFQNYALYPHMTVAQNMGFGLKMMGRPRAEVDAAVRRAAEILRITEQLGKRPKELSGGQKQRVAIGRAITRSPEVFLFDEPLSNLDAALRTQMRVELGRLHSELRATMIYVTHDQVEAMTMADRIVVLNAGAIEQVGSPLELYNRPANWFVAGFLGSPRMNFFRARVEEADADGAALSVPGLPGTLALDLDPVDAAPLEPGDAVTLGIRPEHLEDGGSGRWSLPARVAVVESLGRETLLYVDAAPLQATDAESHEGYLAVHRSSQLPYRAGDEITLTLDPEALLLFDGTGRTRRVSRRASAGG
jgi:multiple sugar transport system ATP-binding protein